MNVSKPNKRLRKIKKNINKTIPSASVVFPSDDGNNHACKIEEQLIRCKFFRKTSQGNSEQLLEPTWKLYPKFIQIYLNGKYLEFLQGKLEEVNLERPFHKYSINFNSKMEILKGKILRMKAIKVVDMHFQGESLQKCRDQGN